MNTVAVIGAGSFGTAVAMTLAGTGKDVDLYCRTSDQAALITNTRENRRYFPGNLLHHKITAKTDLAELERASAIFLAFPAKEMDHYVEYLTRYMAPETVVINLVKGLHDEKLTFAALFESNLPRAHYVALKGPTFARPLFLAEWSGMTCVPVQTLRPFV